MLKGTNYREIRGMPYVRKEYIRGKPQLKIAKFSSGEFRDDYDYKIELVVEERRQIRHNALEAARLGANKTLASAGDNSFFSSVKVYPHVVLRENKMIATAGADRLQEGMRRAFGKATGLAARVKPGDTIYEAYVKAENLQLAKQALKIAAGKLGCLTITKLTQLRQDEPAEE
ncbi:MAG TPA: 50S ribosomal protein L16 [Nitrososphaeraceae archaeon]|nr:50S ribosomal protein L16 [Nitrososphaeraceae archaeon]